jgi:hypothetical protein
MGAWGCGNLENDDALDFPRGVPQQVPRCGTIRTYSGSDTNTPWP